LDHTHTFVQPMAHYHKAQDSKLVFYFRPILAKFPYFTPKSATNIQIYEQYWLCNH
jgi:hypothetical protein